MKKKSKLSYEELEQSTFVCAHDLKEPLRLVSNFMQILLKHNSSCFDELSIVYVRHILKNIDRMDALITNILTYSQVSATENMVDYVDLNELVENIKDDFELVLQEINGSIEVNNLPVLAANPTQMYQLFLNLISNAIKFKSKEPLLINISAFEEQEKWELKIKDNGIGIDQKFHTNVFDMFKRLNSKHDYEGSGMGLTICKKIVEAHGGIITLESIPTGGCEFKITLPKNC